MQAVTTTGLALGEIYSVRVEQCFWRSEINSVWIYIIFNVEPSHFFVDLRQNKYRSSDLTWTGKWFNYAKAMIVHAGYTRELGNIVVCDTSYVFLCNKILKKSI